MKRGRESIIRNKVRNGMTSTSTCTLTLGNGKVKIIKRGMRSRYRDGELTLENGDNVYVSRVEETSRIKESRGEGEERGS